jgi:hypothetical protein
MVNDQFYSKFLSPYFRKKNMTDNSKLFLLLHSNLVLPYEYMTPTVHLKKTFS